MSIPGEFLLVAALMAVPGVAAVTDAATPAKAPVAQVAQYQGKAPTVTMSDAVLVLAQR